MVDRRISAECEASEIPNSQIAIVVFAKCKEFRIMREIDLAIARANCEIFGTRFA